MLRDEPKNPSRSSSSSNSSSLLFAKKHFDLDLERNRKTYHELNKFLSFSRGVDLLFFFKVAWHFKMISLHGLDMLKRLSDQALPKIDGLWQSSGRRRGLTLATKCNETV